jgi:3-dehydroquinate dehydratase / shikimate dehydrogenase
MNQDTHILKHVENCQLCISIGEATLSELWQQIEKASQWADLIEIRLDKLIKIEFEALKRIEQRAPCPLIWTLRKESQGGDFKGTEKERHSILSYLIGHLEPVFMDLEADIPESILKSLQELSPKTKWIIS